MPVRGLLLDSGDTLVGPVGGTWFPGPRFFDVLAEHGVAVDAGVVERAHARAYRVFDAIRWRSIRSEEREVRAFETYYRRLLRAARGARMGSLEELPPFVGTLDGSG